uniref:Chromo domain-containing protein n=1 Tax=Ciona savignyi TaxID=51511 RepID=H2ZJ51_CIOSA
MAPKTAKFSDGERVLCFHGPLMYEAKCMKAELRDSGKAYFYLIHYNGWNKHWDEWVPEARVLKFNDANLIRQKDLLKQHGKDKVKRGKLGKPGKLDKEKDMIEKNRKFENSPLSSMEPKKKKSRADPTVEPEEAYTAKVEINIQIPDQLKPILVDDWDLVTRQKQIYQLPAKMTVEAILNAFLENKHESDNAERNSSLKELTLGITEYFNAMLGSQLLYRFERPQYITILAEFPEKTVHQLYGVPHLLRFFVLIGSMLSYTNLSEKNVAILVGFMHELLSYIQENITSMFNVSDYVDTLTEGSKTAS